MANTIICPRCKSKRIFNLRIDSDWGGGASYYPANEKDQYTAEDLREDSGDRPDIDVHHCKNCGTIFDR